MGVPMALNLIKAGYSVTVWNRDATKCRVPVEVCSTCRGVFYILALDFVEGKEQDGCRQTGRPDAGQASKFEDPLE